MGKLPIPTIYPHTKAFWEGTKQKRLLIPYCQPCARYFFYPRVRCPSCYGEEITMKEVEKRGTLETFSTLAYPPSDAFAPKLPYTLGIVRLSVDILMFMEIRGSAKAIQVGAAGIIGFEQRGDFFLPFFTVDS